MQRITLQKYAVMSILSVSLVALAPGATAQSPSPNYNRKLPPQTGSGQNKMALKQYTWVETQQMLLKGDVKSTQLFQCQYGPDGRSRKLPSGRRSHRQSRSAA